MLSRTWHWHSWSRVSSKKPKSKQETARESPRSHGLIGINIGLCFSSAKSKPVPPLKWRRATRINQNVISQKLYSLCYYQKYQFWSLRPLKNNYPWCNMHQSREVWVWFLDLYLSVIQQQLCALQAIAFSSCWTSLQFAFTLMGFLPWSTTVCTPFKTIIVTIGYHCYFYLNRKFWHPLSYVQRKSTVVVHVSGGWQSK